MSTLSIDESPLPNGKLDQQLETFRKECESLDHLVDELFEQLEDVNQRLTHKSSEIEQQRSYFEEREQQWRQKQSENEDLREFFVHQNDQISAAIEKLTLFEGKLDSDANGTRTDELKTLLTEMRAEQASMRQERSEVDEHQKLEISQWSEQLTRQGEQFSEVLEKLAAFEGKLQSIAPAAGGEANEQLAGLLADLQEQLAEFHDRSQSPSEAGESFDSSNLEEQLAKHGEQLSTALEKLGTFEEQLVSLSQADSSDAPQSNELQDLINEVRDQREELRQRMEEEQKLREREHETLQQFSTRHDEQHGESIGKLAAVEARMGEFSVAGSSSDEAPLTPKLNELIEQLKLERDEFRERFERASEEAARLTELIAGLANSSGEADSVRDTKITEALSASESARQELDQELVAAKSRAAELEKVVARQQEELHAEKNELRQQLSELRELLQMRSQWNNEPEAAAAGDNGNQTMVFNEKPEDDGGDQSVLAQFAKLSRK